MDKNKCPKSENRGTFGEEKNFSGEVGPEAL